MLEIRVLLKDRAEQFYLLTVERRDLDVYCFVPKLGVHLSRHRSGESHFKNEGKVVLLEDQPPVAMMGSA